MIEFMPVGGGSRTPNETRFASVGPARQTAEEVFFVGAYTDPLAGMSSDQLFSVAPQFQGLNPFGLLRRF